MYSWYLRILMVVATVTAAEMVQFVGPFRINPDVAAALIQNRTSDEIHRNILLGWDPTHIIASSQLARYLSEHLGSNHTIYVPEDRTFIDMSSVIEDSRGRLSSEGGINPTPKCTKYIQRWTAQTRQAYGNWVPVSKCVRTGLGQAGGTVSLGWSTSVSVSADFGLDANIIVDLLSASLGVSVTKTWTKSDEFGCNIPAYSVGQLWEQTLMAYGELWSQGCARCTTIDGGDEGCGGGWGYDPRKDGDASAPVNDKYQLGCSTGEKNVQC